MKEQKNLNSSLDQWRISAFLIVVGVIFVVFVYRLVVYQFIEGDQWKAQAEDNRVEVINIPTRRGVIYDRNGILLAKNIASYNVAITPANLPDDPADIETIIRELAEYISLPIHKGSIENDILINCGDNLGISEMLEIGTSFSPFSPVLVECDIDRELAMVLQEKSIDWPGVSVEIEPIRDYPTGEVTAPIVGFLGPIPESRQEELSDLGFILNQDKVGYAGIELYFDELLRGNNGKRIVEVDVAGEVLRDIAAEVPKQDGYNVVLTVDTRLQEAASAIVEGEIKFWNTWLNEYKISSGVAIAVNPSSGEILAIVSWPSYENNRFARFIPSYYYQQLVADLTYPLQNSAVWGEMPAGSVFKLVTSVGALNEGVVTPEQIIKTPGSITIQNVYTPNDRGLDRVFVDWNEAQGGFGQLDFIGGLSNSSNVYFYKLGGGFPPEVEEGGLGICRLGTYARALGYGSTLGIELPEESDGLIPDPTWKRINQGENWSTGDTYISAVGQGFMIATPLQVLMSAATIANDGVLMRPTLVKEVVDDENNPVIVVMDQYGNLIEGISEDIDGNIYALVYKKNLSPTPLVIVNSEGRLNDLSDEIFYKDNGEILGFEIVQPYSEDVDQGLSIGELLVYDLDGKIIPHIKNEDGSLSIEVYQEVVEQVTVKVMTGEGQIVEHFGETFYNEDGEEIELILMSPWAQDQKWDLTQDPMIEVYSNPEGIGSCKPTGEIKTVDPWVFQKIQEGMRAAVTQGTLQKEFKDFPYSVAGKTGTAEYCDAVALANNRCIYGNWPTHAWTVAYAPYENPEIAVVAFLYNGSEGASVAGPVVRKIIQAYFELKAIDAAAGLP